MGIFITDGANPVTSDQSPFVGQNLVDNSDETIITLGSSSNPAASGASITFTATVSGVTPTGTVTFQIDGFNLATNTLSSGVATFSISTLAVGSHLVAAFYNGDSNNAPNFATVDPQTITAFAPPIEGFKGRSRVR